MEDGSPMRSAPRAVALAKETEEITPQAMDAPAGTANADIGRRCAAAAPITMGYGWDLVTGLVATNNPAKMRCCCTSRTRTVLTSAQPRYTTWHRSHYILHLTWPSDSLWCAGTLEGASAMAREDSAAGAQSPDDLNVWLRLTPMPVGCAL